MAARQSAGRPTIRRRWLPSRDVVTRTSRPAGLTLLLDFDGTVCRGDEPALEYGRQVASTLPTRDGDVLMAALSGLLDGTGNGLPAGRQAEHPAIAGAEDGYQAVERLAIAFGVAAERRSAAFLAARAKLVAGQLPVETPAGLAGLLAELRPRVTVVLVTNSPLNGMDTLLRRLGLAGRLDEVIGDAGKPAGLGPVVDRLLARSGAGTQPGRLLSVGDIWANDLQVPLERGCGGAYIDRFGRRRGTAHVTAPAFEPIFDAIRGWSADPSVLVPGRPTV